MAYPFFCFVFRQCQGMFQTSFGYAYGQYVIGRMGLPYAEKNVNIISIVVDAPQDIISALSGKLGRLRGITSKALYSNIGS